MRRLLELVSFSCVVVAAATGVFLIVLTLIFFVWLNTSLIPEYIVQIFFYMAISLFMLTGVAYLTGKLAQIHVSLFCKGNAEEERKI